jgi:nitrite reductase/ring-hydroxylating ferredoxin subunit/DMSO/TMAO reductase YedYZ heme-binding membrane subunit
LVSHCAAPSSHFGGGIGCAQDDDTDQLQPAMGALSMSVKYQAIGWNRQKRLYDSLVAGAVTLYLGLFIGVGAVAHPNATIETLLIRGFGTAAILLLHVILCIGPLCRLNSRFLPLLYNRRHLGVTMFLLALVHGVFAIVQFHALGDTPALVSVFTSNTRFNSVADFPFEPFGVFALLILFLMAATSHDFWLHNLTPRVWKTLHMLVYLAYAVLVAHVSFGALQSETSPVLVTVLAIGLLTVLSLHVAAGLQERHVDHTKPAATHDGFILVCDADRIPENRAVIVSVAGERVAVFRYEGKVSAISNVCRHQNGPLGEGRIIDGCITCPWHGYQYRPETGASPPPFNDKVPTFQTKIVNGRVLLHPCAHAPGTYIEPAQVR